jgi:uncharacterized protein DUF6886
MPLYHFSEEPDIKRFEPRPSPSAGDLPDIVWAIDDAHAVMYYVPRDCPRACFWPGPNTTDADRERFFGAVDAPMVIAVENAWLERIRTATLYRYTMPPETFRPARDDDSGHHVSAVAVTPLAVEPVGDLLSAIAAENVELRITPSLIDLWRRVIASTLEFSGTRLRHAKGYPTTEWG